jgi:hypothetical protein
LLTFKNILLFSLSSVCLPFFDNCLGVRQGDDTAKLTSLTVEQK